MPGDVAILARVGFGHVGEAGTQRVVVAADQRVLPHEVDVIGDQHQLAGMQFGIDRSGSVGEDHAIDAALAELANSQRTHNNIPAMQADIKLAMVPAATAFNPRRATSDLRVGAKAPMPPTWMATELRLAKPQSA